MKRFALILIALLLPLQVYAFDLWGSGGLWGANSPLLPGATAQTAFLSFDNTLNGSPSGAPVGTFTRTTNAWNPETGLIAPHNYNLYSQDLRVASSHWTTTASSRALDNIVAPDGMTTGDTVTVTSNANNLLYETLPPTTSSGVDTFTISRYIKPGTVTWIRYTMWAGVGDNGITVWFDVAAGTKGSVATTAGATHIASGITLEPNGWRRIYITGIPRNTAGDIYTRLDVVDGDNAANHAAVSGLSYGIWGALLSKSNVLYTYDSRLTTTTAAAYSTPRFSTTAKQGTSLLVEEAASNLCLQSQAAGTTWTQTGITIAADSIADPFGLTTTADTLTATQDNATWVQTPTATTNIPKTWSLYLKRKTGTGAVSMSLDGGSTYTAKTLTTDWQRFSITQTIAAHSLVLKLATNTDAVYVWQSDLTETAYPVSMIPTTTASATRAIEYDTYNTTGVIAATGGTVQGWVKPVGVGGTATRTIWSSYTDANNWTSVEYVHGTGFVATKRVAGTTKTVTHTTAAVSDTWYLVTLVINANKTLDLFINGIAGATNTTDTTGTPVIAATMVLGAINGTLGFDGYLDNFRFFSTQLTAQQALSYYNRNK